MKIFESFIILLEREMREKEDMNIIFFYIFLKNKHKFMSYIK